jgi:gliding motility-associated-like protein/uncharacterized repeat protein (TIGR01451 family)
MRIIEIFIKSNILFFFTCLSTFAQIDTQFWFAAPDISQSHGDTPINLVITAFDRSADIIITQPANDLFIPIQLSINPFSSVSYNFSSLKSSIETSGVNVIRNSGLFISSSNLVTANYSINAGLNPETFSLKGSNAVGNEFIITSQKHLFSRRSDGYNAAYILATEDNTNITITPTVDLIGRPKGETFTVNLNKGQVYVAAARIRNLFNTLEAGNQIGGTKVFSDKPIAITLSDDSVSFSGSGCQDLNGDQLLPACLAANEFITLPGSLNVNVGGQTNVSDIVYIYPIQDNTIISINGNTVSGAKNAGEYFSFFNKGGINKFVSDKPVLIYQLSGNGCEVGGAVIPDILRSGLKFSSVNRITSENFLINVITKIEHIDEFEISGLSRSIDFNWKIIDSNWAVSNLNLSDINLVKPGETLYFKNNSGKFNLGVIHGGGGSGTRFSYFSNFSISLKESELNVSCKDGIAVFSILDSLKESGKFQISYDDGNNWIDVDSNISGFVISGPFNSILTIEKRAFFDGLLVRYVENNEICSLNSFPSRLNVDCPPVDLGIVKSTYNDIHFYGDEFEYTLIVSNLGDTDASDVEVIDDLPFGLEYKSSQLIGSPGVQMSKVVEGQKVTFLISDLKAGQIAEIKLKVKVRPFFGQPKENITNTATVRSIELDVNSSNNSSRISVEIQQFFIPNVITPNNDRKNDEFVINGLSKFASNELIIFDRWGSHIFQKKGYQNDWSGEGLAAGTYFYILSVLDINGNPSEFKGWIQIIRE